MVPKINIDQLANILVDNNNEFLSEEGKLYPLVEPMIEGGAIVGRMNLLLASARQRNVPVFHLPLSFSSDYQEMGTNPYGINAAIKNAGALQKGTWGAQVAYTIDTANDTVIEGKSTTCAFASTNLNEELRNRGVRQIILGGFLSNICIESTMRTAYGYGFEVFALTDCSAALSQEAHDNAVENNWPMFSYPIDVEKLVAGLRQTRWTV